MNTEHDREGKFEFWYEDDQLFEIEFYQRGKLEGEHKIWYNNGQIYEHNFYRDDKLNGECKTWHANGVLWVKEFYHDGLVEGEHKYWNENGRLKLHRFFRNGMVILSRFTLREKCNLLKIRKWTYAKRFIPIIDRLLIPDLTKLICHFIPS